MRFAAHGATRAAQPRDQVPIWDLIAAALPNPHRVQGAVLDLVRPKATCYRGFMSLKGKAKTEYQREYMRRRRAEKAAAKPRAKIGPAERQRLEARIHELEAELERERAIQRRARAKARGGS